MKFLRIAIILLILLALAAFFLFTADNDPQEIILDLIRGEQHGYFWIILIISGLTILSTLTGLPVFYFGVALGFILPLPAALALSWAINLAAIMLTYLMVKKVYYNFFSRKYGKKKVMQQIDQKLEKYGIWTIIITRGVYVIPTNIVNFSFPLSKITLRQYTIGTMLGLIPEVLINVISGHLIKHQVRFLSSPQQDLLKAAIIAAILFVLAAVFIFFYFRRRKVRKARINQIVPDLDEE